jgi:TPP-dependent pyruvate/acetoin dehydrogenase alpha subunit
VASHLDINDPDTSRVGRHVQVPRTDQGAVQRAFVGSSVLRIDAAHRLADEVARYPEKLPREAFYRLAYPLMVLSRRLEEGLLELFQKGYVKGTVTISIGNEATALGMSLPFRPGRDVVSLLHRDFIGHLLLGSTPYQLVCQYLANADSRTPGKATSTTGTPPPAACP